MKKGIIKVLIIFTVFFISSWCSASDGKIEKDLQKNLQKSKAIIEKASEKLRARNSVIAEISRLKSLAEEIKSSDFLLREKFTAGGEEIKALGPKAQERHRATEEGYRKALEEYLSLINNLPPDGQVSETDIDNIKALLEKILPKKKGHIFGTLPYTHLNYPAKEPSADLPIKPAYKGGNKTVSPDDIKETAEAPISEEIATLAQSLNWNPVSIYEYVKNNVETEWYWGCMKGAEETLRQKSGNDCDQAALFAALLRASGFPTRYVRGTIEFFAGGKNIVIDKVKNLTGIDDPWKIAEFFQKAGIPFKPMMSGGNISNFQIEHIWIESQIPYDNYRGAIIDEQGKTWLGLDTSIKIKGYAYNSPIDIFQQPAISGQFSAMRDEYLNAMHTETPIEYLEEKLSALSGQQSAEGYKLTRILIPDIMNILPASMQFEQRRITNEYIEIPDELKHKVRFTAADTNNNELFTITFDALELSNQRIAISYEPETVEDQEIIDSYGGLDNTPAYLVRLRPMLKVNGKMVAAGQDGLPMGEEHNLTIDLISPNSTETVINNQITGNVVAIGIVAGKAVAGARPSAPSQEGDKDAEQLLYGEAINHIDRWNKAEDELASLLHLALTRPIPTVVTVGGVIDVTYVLDMPHGYEWKGDFIDASIRAADVIPSHSPLPQGEEGEMKKTFMQLSALQGSILENRIFEDDFRVDAISTAKLFEIANANQTPILTIDSSNIASVLPTLPFDENIKGDISNTVNQNLKVRIPQQEITYDDWTGIGYIKENPQTGESGYMLTGMIAGGMTAVSPGRWPSVDLETTLDKPYSGNVPTNPVMVNIIYPYDGATLSVSPIDVEGAVSDPIAAVNVNGVKAVVSKNGRFIAKGVSLSEGVNQIAAAAATLMGKSDSQTISVNYQPAQVPPITITIMYPTAGAEISRPSTMVRGTVASNATEISIKINGMPAEIYGNQFVINNVPLVDGDNAIIANAIDSNGAVGRAEVSVQVDTANPYVTLNANIISGIPPLTSYFSVSTSIPNAVTAYQIDFEGDGTIDYTGDTFDNISYTYTTEGVYYPTITVTDDRGNTYTDSIAITVLNKEAIDALLKGKWEGMKGALARGDIGQASQYFADGAIRMYQYNIELLEQYLSQIAQDMQDIKLVEAKNNLAEYEMLAFQGGIERSFYIVFVKDSTGIWRIYFF